MTRAIQSASVLMPTFQGARHLDRALDAIARQVDVAEWDLAVVDSGSRDGTAEILARWQKHFPVPMRVRQITQDEFDHGDTRNLLAATSRGELLVYLTQDAIPHDATWLARLLRNFEDPAVGAAYCRQVSRPDAAWTTERLSHDDPARSIVRREVRLPDRDRYAAMDPHERRLLYDFSNVASALRRSLWARHPFPRTHFGEDVLMARALLEAGHTIVYDPEAIVEHSHDFDPSQAYARAECDGAFNAEWLGRICVASRTDADSLAERFAQRDEKALDCAPLEASERRQTAKALRDLRRSLFRGLHAGAARHRASGRPQREPTRMLEQDTLHILYVVHGFPPESGAGTEIYTLELARAMHARGHRVTIFSRSPGKAGDAEEFEVSSDTFAGLRVYRMPHHLEHARLRESFHEPRAEAAFASVLDRERPDVVHFQHLLHMSAGLVAVARSRGLPSLITAHDYWALCPRVQMIRPDGQRCARNMGLGCHVCVKEGRLRDVPRWAGATRWLGPLGDAAGRILEEGSFGSLAAERARSYRDLREREAFVLDAYAANDLVIAPSRFLRERLLETGAFDAERFVFSENGIASCASSVPNKLPDPKGRLRLGFIGSLVSHKGVDVLLRAMRRIEGAPVSLGIHGAFHPETDAHHAALRELATDAITFHGRFEHDRLADAFAQIDVLVVPSVWFENCPTTIREAFLARTPVVASDLGGMAESVRDGIDGMLFPPGDDAALARGLLRFVEEPGLLELLSREFPSVKSIGEDAALMEARYRSLCTFAEARADRGDVLGGGDS